MCLRRREEGQERDGERNLPPEQMVQLRLTDAGCKCGIGICHEMWDPTTNDLTLIRF